MHAAAAKPGGLPDRIEARNDRAAVAENAASRSVSKPPSVLRVRIFSRTAISGPWAGSRMRCGVRGADQLVAEIAPGVMDAHHLRVLGEGVGDLPVARLDLALERLELRSELPPASAFIAATRSAQVVADDKIHAMGLERLDRRRGFFAESPCAPSAASRDR